MNKKSLSSAGSAGLNCFDFGARQLERFLQKESCHHMDLYFAFTAAHRLSLPLRSAPALTLCEDSFTSNI